MITTLLLLIAVALSVVSLKFAIVPYVWICACWTVSLTGIAATSRQAWVKRAALVFASCGLTLGLVETRVWLATPAPRTVLRYSDTFIQRDDVLGYAPIKNTHVVAELTQNNERIYKVSYTFDDQGYRVSPQGAVRSDRCVLFFGDSYTFGEGVEDSQAMPFVVGVRSGYRVVNFGFQGYGPHQMLAAVQRGRVQKAVNCEPRAIVYQAIVEHAARSAGASPWDQHGPKYETTSAGLKSSGHFDDHIQALIQTQLSKSFLFQRHLFYLPPFVAQRTRLFAEIVDAAKREFAQQYPDAAFDVILWNAPGPSSIEMLRNLRARNIPVRLVSDVLPGYPEKATLYELSPYDRHPTPNTHRMIADDVIQRLLR